jgi:hypothetical protein
VVPRAIQQPLPVWAGVGGSPDSAERAGRPGLPMVLGYIGGTLGHLRPLVDARTPPPCTGRPGLTFRPNGHWHILPAAASAPAVGDARMNAPGNSGPGPLDLHAV